MNLAEATSEVLKGCNGIPVIGKFLPYVCVMGGAVSLFISSLQVLIQTFEAIGNIPGLSSFKEVARLLQVRSDSPLLFVLDRLSIVPVPTRYEPSPSQELPPYARSIEERLPESHEVQEPEIDGYTISQLSAMDKAAARFRHEMLIKGIEQALANEKSNLLKLDEVPRINVATKKIDALSELHRNSDSGQVFDRIATDYIAAFPNSSDWMSGIQMPPRLPAAPGVMFVDYPGRLTELRSNGGINVEVNRLLNQATRQLQYEIKADYRGTDVTVLDFDGMDAVDWYYNNVNATHRQYDGRNAATSVVGLNPYYACIKYPYGGRLETIRYNELGHIRLEHGQAVPRVDQFGNFTYHSEAPYPRRQIEGDVLPAIQHLNVLVSVNGQTVKAEYQGPNSGEILTVDVLNVDGTNAAEWYGFPYNIREALGTPSNALIKWLGNEKSVRYSELRNVRLVDL